MEAAGATASIVGIISFGLGLAKSLQAFIDSVIEAEETITLIAAEVNATTSTLKRLQNFIDQDRAASKEQNRATVFNDTGINEIGMCALQCQKIYVQIILLIEKASMPASEDGSKDKTPQAPAAVDQDPPVVRLAVFSKNVTRMGRKMRWPWLEPRIKRCQEHLGRLKVSLMLSLQVFLIAESRARHAPSVARISGTADENEIRDKAEALRKRLTDLRAKKNPPKQPSRQIRPPGSEDGVREASHAASSTNSASTPPVNSSNIRDPSVTESAFSSGSNRPRNSHERGTKRAVRTWNAFKVRVQNTAGRREIFRKDATSPLFEAYLIHFPGGMTSKPQPPIKLPFGHRRLTREAKQTLRKYNPWDIFVNLSPHERSLIEKVVQQVQLAATGITNVCLVAIDIGGKSDVDMAALRIGVLMLTKMILFFRHEPICAQRQGTEGKTDMIGRRAHFAAAVRSVFPGSQLETKKQLELQGRMKREDDERKKEEAKSKIDREMFQKDKEEMEKAKQALEADRARVEEESNMVDIEKQALKHAAEAVLKSIEKGTAGEELEKILEEERAKKKASEEKTAAERAKLPVKFKDTLDRKYSFPFHMVQTWEGMEDLIKQALHHVDSVGPHVLEGRYDLLDSEGQVILPSTWAATIKPGASVSMLMWPQEKLRQLPPPASLFPTRPMQGVAPGVTPEMGGISPPMLQPAVNPPTAPTPAGMLPHRYAEHGYMPAPAPRLNMWSPPPVSQGFTGPPLVEKSAAPPQRASGSHRGANKPLGFSSARRPRRSVSKKSVYAGYWSSSKDPDDIDKELGLDDLETSERLASKDVDELLAAWTNPARGEDDDQARPPA